MDTEIKYSRFVKSNWVPLLCGLFFTTIFYIVFLYFNSKIIVDYTIADILNQYKILIPGAFGLLTIIVLYILYFIKWVVRLNYWAVNLILIFIAYGFSLVFGIQLCYYEPRFTPIAMFIIDNFGKPMMYASIGAILLSIVFVFIKKKSS